MNEKISLVFFGSGPLAASSLESLLQNFEVEVIITKPTTKAEMEIIAKNIPVLCVSNKQELSELFKDHRFKSNVGVLIDFGIIVARDVINYFEYGIVNSHFSLLPELRGADPISFAILEGKEETGVSLMLLVEAMDEGPLLSVKKFELNGGETSIELSTKLVQLSHRMLVETLPKYLAGEIKPQAQDVQTISPTYTRKLTKADGMIDWTKSAEIIEREIRAFIEWPKSYASFGGTDVVITQAEVINASGAIGKLLIYEKQLAVYCGKDSLLIKKIKPAGRNEMDSTAFLAGYKNRLSID